LTEAQTLEDALDPTFWSAQSEQIMRDPRTKGRGDIIEVRKPDIGLYAKLLVVETSKGYVKTVLVETAKPVDVALPESGALATKWNVGTKTHDVIRRADNHVLQGGFQTKAAAAEWINKHLAAMAA
jgi:hypothetical protein